MRQRVRVGLVLAVIGVSVVGACDAGEMVADAMVDAGEMLADAGETVRDASSDDAAAQLDGDTAPAGPTLRVFDVPCDVETVVYEVNTGFGYTHRRRNWHAEVPDVGLDAIASVTAFGCGFAADEPGADDVPPLDCRALVTQFEDGRIRVHCGSGTEVASGCVDGEACTGFEVLEGEGFERAESVWVSVLVR